jgi:hypothetical protein
MIPVFPTNWEGGDRPVPISLLSSMERSAYSQITSSMRTSPSNFCSIWPLAATFAGLFCLASLLLVPVSVLASATQASVNSERRSDRVRSSAHRVHRRHTAHNSRTRRHSISTRPSSRRSSAHIQHAAQHRRRSHRRSRRLQTEVALENIRTHTTPTEAATADMATANTGADDGAQSQSLARPELVGTPESAEQNTPSADAIASQAGSAGRDMPIFSSGVPRYMPAALRGSHEVLVHQNIIADVEGLSRIQNDSQMSAMVRSGDLVALPASSALFVDTRLPLNRRYCRPWTAKFLSDLSRAHEKFFGHPLQLTSAVRTVDFQRHLAHYNGNAAPAYGDTASPHLTGEAIDLGKKGMSLHEIAWMRAVLGHLQARGKLDVEEEFEQACFHISVYKTYTPHRSLPAHLVAASESTPANEVQSEDSSDTASTAAIGGLARPVSQPIQRRTAVRHAHSSSAHTTRHAVAHRRRHHRAAMSLLAARMR